MLKKLLRCTDCKHPYAHIEVEAGDDETVTTGRCYNCELRRLHTEHAVKQQAAVDDVMKHVTAAAPPLHPNCRSYYALPEEEAPEPQGPQKPAVFIHPLTGQKIYQPPFDILAGNHLLPDILEYCENGQTICHWHKVVDTVGTIWYADDNDNRWQYRAEA